MCEFRTNAKVARFDGKGSNRKKYCEEFSCYIGLLLNFLGLVVLFLKKTEDRSQLTFLGGHWNPVQGLDDNGWYGNDHWELNGNVIKQMANAARFYHAPEAGMTTTGDRRNGQKTAIVGPVYIVCDAEANPRKISPTQKQILMISIAGINLSYDRKEQALYYPMGVLNVQLFMEQAYWMWHMIIEAAIRQKVQIVVTSAIGCGAFKGNFQNIATYYANALKYILSTKNIKTTLRTFVICFIKKDIANHGLFSEVFEGYSHDHINVVILPDHDMIHITDRLSEFFEKDNSVALVNPSDYEAVREGKIGMYFDGGHIAVEEMLALSTTVLTMHVKINSSLWMNPKNKIEVREYNKNIKINHPTGDGKENESMPSSMDSRVSLPTIHRSFFDRMDFS